jgi:hypothetical protein
MNWPMLVGMTVAVPALLAGWAYWMYGNTTDVIGAAVVGVILMGGKCSAGAAREASAAIAVAWASVRG